MKPEDIEKLDRRNTMDTSLILEKLTNIDSKVDRVDGTTQENYRALRGHNGDAGLVASMEILKKSFEKKEKKDAEVDGKIEKLKTELHGEGKDDGGIVGEQIQIRKVQKWIMGLGTIIVTAVVVQIVIGLLGM